MYTSQLRSLALDDGEATEPRVKDTRGTGNEKDTRGGAPPQPPPSEILAGSMPLESYRSDGGVRDALGASVSSDWDPALEQDAGDCAVVVVTLEALLS
jgi:hypothetical protein